MVKVSVPTFEEKKLRHTGFKVVSIKNKPDHDDVMKISRLLPGMPAGYVSDMRIKELVDKGSIPVHVFYDMRQRTTKLNGFNINIHNN